MKKLLMFILVIALLSAASACKEKESSPPPENREIVVMSFNVRTIGIEPEPERAWEVRKQDVVALVLRYSPDIIGFQELKNTQLEYMQKNLTGYGSYGVNGWYDHSLAPLLGGVNAVFYKLDRFTLTESRTLWLSETPKVRSTGWDSGETDYRTLSEVKFTDNLNGKVFTFINTHLTYNAPLAMENSSKMLAGIAADNGGPLILTGDFNYQQDTANYQYIVSGVMKDSKVLAPDSDEGGTFHSFGGAIDKPWPKPIDFIFVTDAYFEVSSYKIIRDHNESGHYPSDHYPIKAVLKYKDI